MTRLLPYSLDVETVAPRSRLASVADAVLAPAEAAVLATLPPRRTDKAVLPVLDAQGGLHQSSRLGLGLPFERCTFEGDGDQIRLAPSEIAPDAGSLQFTQRALGPSHLMAVAVRQGSGPPWLVVSHPS